MEVLRLEFKLLTLIRQFVLLAKSRRTSTYEISTPREDGYGVESSAVKGTECLLQIHYAKYNVYHDNKIYTILTVQLKLMLQM